MDAPLLALTRKPSNRISGLPPRDVAAENMRQLIQLRWIAVAGQLLAILVAHLWLGIRLPIVPMVSVVTILALANLVFAATLSRLLVRGEVSLSLLLDMAALTAQLYFSGGADNPFVSLYLLQVVLGAILLPPAVAGMMAAAACAFAAFLSVQHRPLDVPSPVWGSAGDVMLAGRLLAFAMVAVLLVLFITRISRNLRARDAYVAELGQRAAEEEGIVRMGLFASGAAHELGTPLSTLSVLIADWLRNPAFAKDPAIKQEFDEARAEVDRCKAIVSNILHSAGQERGEAMASMLAQSLLGQVARDWRDQHPSLAFECSLHLGEAKIAAEPALRQAIWSLLENGADASPSGLALDALVERDQVVITVRDNGPGFSEVQLRSAGQLYHSTKGPGHGLGLFLAANVARQLGGMLDIANRPGGGAAVRLVLPLASASQEA